MPTPTFQIAIDTSDCHAVADFWAAALGYEVEHHDEQIRGLLDAGVATAADVIERGGHLCWTTGAACTDPTGARPRLLFQNVPEPKTVKNRVHLDIHIGPDGRDAEVERLVGLGATRLWEASQGPHSWVTLADPEGNEFCVA